LGLFAKKTLLASASVTHCVVGTPLSKWQM
jgi:hypothetical protein